MFDVTSTSLIPRSANTVRLQELMDEVHRQEIAARIRKLREESPLTQHAMAERLHMTQRNYQKIEKDGTTLWDRVTDIAKVHGVEPRTIWYGEATPTPEPLEAPAWAVELRSQNEAMLAEIQGLREEIGQVLLGQALDAEDQARPEAPAESELQAKPKRSRRAKR